MSSSKSISTRARITAVGGCSTTFSKKSGCATFRSSRLCLAVSVKPFSYWPYRSGDISVTAFLYIQNWLHLFI